MKWEPFYVNFDEKTNFLVWPFEKNGGYAYLFTASKEAHLAVEAFSAKGEQTMKIHHLRSATCVIEVGENHLLIDPMLSGKGALPPFARFRHRPELNPTVALPANADEVLDGVTHCLITHCQAFGVGALRHTDHLDDPGLRFLRERETPVLCRTADARFLEKSGVSVVETFKAWKPALCLGGEVTAVPARHGHGWIHRVMANGVGFYIAVPGEPSVYIAGDTVFTPTVTRALSELKPDIAVVAAGSASLDVGGPILMPMAEILSFAAAAPGVVVANHLEALNHCPTTRAGLAEALEAKGLRHRVRIPDDGETLVF